MSKYYQKLFAFAYDRVLSPVEKKLAKRRSYLLSHLNGNILDVGGGTGVNIPFYNDAANVLLIEPSKEMMAKAKTKYHSKENITFLNCGVNDSLLNTEIKPKSLDAIVCTLVLCTIPNVQLALENFKKWLTPNGKLIVLEHIASDHAIHSKWQNIINPAWNVIGEGCNLNRQTDETIKSQGFTVTEEEYFGGSIQFYQGIFQNKN